MVVRQLSRNSQVLSADNVHYVKLRFCRSCSSTLSQRLDPLDLDRTVAVVLSQFCWPSLKRLGQIRRPGPAAVGSKAAWMLAGLLSGLSECVRFSLDVQATWRVSVILAGHLWPDIV
jgi:hypothetical protein